MRFTTGLAVEELNGSAGGTTASRNKSRAYFKVRTAPRNPRTGSQITVRGRLSIASRAWAALTEAERSLWDEWAKTQVGRRVLGKAAVLSGFNAYCRLYLNATSIEQTPLTSPPTDNDMGELNEIVVKNATATGITVNAMMQAGASIGSNNKYLFEGMLVVEITPILKPGRASDVSGLRFVANGENGSTTITPGQSALLREATVSAAYQEKFRYPLKAGDKVQIRVKAISAKEGQVGLSTLKFTQVVTIPEAPAS